MKTTIALCALAFVGAHAGCPCANCPATGNFNGACCHGNKTCETQNWTPQTCTPEFGTWCAWEPQGKCGFDCEGDCAKCQSYSNAPYCQSGNGTNCERDCKGTFCPLSATVATVATVLPTAPEQSEPAAVAAHAEPDEPLAHFNTATQAWEPCPCQPAWPYDCPPAGFDGACCHGNRTCETQNWKKETCTPDMGTWCERPPPGYCPCAGCPPKGTAGACCHGNRTCETQNWTPQTCTPEFGTWCAAS